jgi:hypothetical protein
VNVNDKIKNKRCKRKKIGLMEWLKVKVLSSSPSTVKGKKKGLVNFLPQLALNCDPPDLCLLNS